MSELLLATKTSLPPARNNLVSRPRLTARLNEALHPRYRLTLISAPAGYGKTTLVVDWLLGADWPFAWLSLDENDNDPARFFAYLITAMQSVDPNIGQVAQTMMQSPQPLPPETILTTLVNDIADTPQPFVLVLDDYHVIHTPPIHHQLVFLLEHMPTQMHLVLITREDPLLPIVRLRARGQALEIRQGDLRFSKNETAEFLKGVMGLALSIEEIAALERRTEGWIAGLQLAALSMQGRDDLKGFVQAFTGSSRLILDYLIEEVFERQSPEVRDFLLKTSILERLCGPLCDQVAKKNASQEMLETLEQANLFIFPLDQSRVWYRYHRLFAELLRHRLRVSYPDSEADLHRRASQWFEAQGLTAEAIEHTISSGDWERAAALINQAADGLLKHGELVTLIGWCQKLPPHLIREQPDFGMSYTWALLLSGQFDKAEALLDYFEEVGRSVPVLLGQVLTAQAYAARSRGDNSRVIEKSEEALELLPESEIVSRTTLSLNLGMVYWHEGRLREAVPPLNKAQELAYQTDNHYADLAAQIFLARALASQGALRQAEERLRETLHVGGEIPILALTHYDLAGIYYEWNELGKAWEHAEKGLELSTRSGNVEFQNAGHLLKASLFMAQGNTLGALSEAETSHALSGDYGPAKQGQSMACHAQIALAMGDVPTAERWVAQMPVKADVNSFYRFIGLIHARLFLAQGNKPAAREYLAGHLNRALQEGWGYATIAIRALQAQAAQTEEAAFDILSEALKLSRPEGFIRTYVDSGSALIPLLQECARQGIMPGYVGQILGAYEDREAPSIPLVEPLSDRELEVLRLVTAGLSNREIGEKLVISTGTAKTHVHNICGKLGVHNRTEAASRAKELGLV